MNILHKIIKEEEIIDRYKKDLNNKSLSNTEHELIKLLLERHIDERNKLLRENF